MLMAIIPMANDLGASISGVTLSLATYLLALVLFLPLSGHLFNRFALAQQFLCGLAIFASPPWPAPSARIFTCCASPALSRALAVRWWYLPDEP